MANLETVQATSGYRSETFQLNWDEMTWVSTGAFKEEDFPFIAEIRGKRYELYSDGRFDEEELNSEQGSA